jgi:uncharacterized protein (TIGR02996 family)
MSVSDVQVMRRAVVADPGDDLVRLAYADALEEDGRLTEARAQRYIASRKLGMYYIGDSDRWDIGHFYTDWRYGSDQEEVLRGIIERHLKERVDEDYIIPYFEWTPHHERYVMCSTSGDLTYTDLLGAIWAEEEKVDE